MDLHQNIIAILTKVGEPSPEQKTLLIAYFSMKKETHFTADIGNEVYKWYLFLKDLLEKTDSYNMYSYSFILDMFTELITDNYQEVTDIDFRMQDRSIRQFSKSSDTHTLLFSAAMTIREADTELSKNNFKALLRAIDMVCVDKKAVGPEILLKCTLRLDSMSEHDQETASTILMQNMSNFKNCGIRNTFGHSTKSDVSDNFEYENGSASLSIYQTTMKYDDSPLKKFPLFGPDQIIQHKKDFPNSNLEKGYSEMVYLRNCSRVCTVLVTWNVDEIGRPYFTEKISEQDCDVSMMTIGVLTDSNISLLTNESSHYFSTWKKCLSPDFIEELREEFGHLFI